MTTVTEENPIARPNGSAKFAQIRITHRSPAYWRVTFDNPPINVMGRKWFGSSRK